MKPIIDGAEIVPRLNDTGDVIAYDIFPKQGMSLMFLDLDAIDETETAVSSLMVGNNYDFDNIQDDVYNGTPVKKVGRFSIFTIKEQKPDLEG